MPNSFSGIGGWSAIDADWRDSKTGIASSITNLNNSIAPIFSTSGTYVVGDAVMYNGKRYVSNEDQTMVAWDSTKWTEKSVEDEIGNVETLLAAL